MPDYIVEDLRKVTVNKVLSMRNHWYQAAGSVAKDYVVKLNDNKTTKALKNLISKYRDESETTQDPDHYVPTNEYKQLFDPDLPFTLANEIFDACNGLPLLENGKATNDRRVKQDLVNKFIREANEDNRSWSTINALMCDQNSNEYFLSTITPINQEFHPTYDSRDGVKDRRYGKTGLTSMNERLPASIRTAEESWRPANFWFTELHVSDANGNRGKRLFSGFRSGAFAAYNEEAGPKRKKANLKRALGVVEAIVLQKLMELKNPSAFFHGDTIKTLPIRILSIDLLSDTLAGDAPLVTDHHAALKSLNGKVETFKFLWPDKHNVLQLQEVTAEIRMLDLNLAVNQFSTVVLRKDQAETNEQSFIALGNDFQKWLQQRQQKKAALENQIASIEKFINKLDKEKGKVAELRRNYQLQEKSKLEEKIARMQRKEQQMLALKKCIKSTSLGNYVTAARLANFAYILGFSVHFNCKSGKDRTGLVDIESKFLARELEKLRREGGDVSYLPRKLLNQEERNRHQMMLWESGSLQILERNTRGQSLKVADARKVQLKVRNSMVVGTYDAELAERLGGEQAMLDLRGLAAYTDLIDALVK